MLTLPQRCAVAHPIIAVPVTLQLDALVSPEALAGALMRLAWERSGKPDDAGCDWYTDAAGNTYITADPGWRVSTDPAVAVLVDAAHVLLGYDLSGFRLSAADLALASEGAA